MKTMHEFLNELGKLPRAYQEEIWGIFRRGKVKLAVTTMEERIQDAKLSTCMWLKPNTTSEKQDANTANEPPCIGLDPDTDPCPFCGAAMSDPCRWAEGQNVVYVKGKLQFPPPQHFNKYQIGLWQQFDKLTPEQIALNHAATLKSSSPYLNERNVVMLGKLDEFPIPETFSDEVTDPNEFHVPYAWPSWTRKKQHEYMTFIAGKMQPLSTDE